MSTPTSYAPNVNRSKTKKWVEAKPVDYGGDDWGVDEYEDEDDDLYEPPPSKPTGLRQKGQAIQPVSNNIMNKKSYGELPGLSAQNQHRSMSSTAPSPRRQNSFDQGDEKRAFSSTGVPLTESRTGVPVLQVSTQPPTGLRKASQTELPPVDLSARKSVAQHSDRPDSQSEYTPQTTTTNYSDDIQTRRDYSPSAVPAPLSATVARNSADSPAAHFPPRNSSLSQPPDLSSPRDTAGRPWSENSQSSGGASHPSKKDPSDVKNAHNGSPGMPSTRSPISPSTQKPLPFVRPADIYKRLAEEKERERQSLDSSRPSMESLEAGTVPNRKPSPSDSYHEDAESHEPSAETDIPALHSAKGLMPILEPVQERKSEYGFDGFKPPISHSRDASDATITQTIDENRYSRSPELPNLNRVSGFGDDFFSSKDPSPSGTDQAGETTQEPPYGDSNEPKLRTEPSLGFRTAVTTAFRNADSVPTTPSSRLGDNIGRSDSESTGTSGISPIMSRAPSGRNQDAEAREASTPAIAEVYEPDESAADEKTPVLKGVVPNEEDNSLTPPARPHAERDASFRPNLPGGWNSYATNVSDRTIQSDTPSKVPSAHENSEGEGLDTTPKALKTAILPVHGTEESATNTMGSALAQQSSPTTSEDSSNQVEKISTSISPSGDVSEDDIPPPTPLKGRKTNTTLSVETTPSDDESDRLRKEIVKSLTPKVSATEPNSNSPDVEKELPDTTQNARESYYLPSEYDNYWNEQEDESPAEHSPVASPLQESQKTMPIIPPLVSRKVSKSSEYRPAAERRFSWEADGEQVNVKPVQSSDKQVQSPVVQPPTPTALPDVAKDESIKEVNATNPAGASSESLARPESSVEPNSTSESEAYIGEAALATGGLASAAKYSSKDATMEKSNEDENEQVHPISPSPVSPMEDSDRRGSSPDQNYGKSAPTHTQRLSLSQGTGSGAYTTNTTLKDILKLPNPYDRVRAYGDVQTKLATADTGLGEWLAFMKAENPEYSDIEGNYGGLTPFVSSSTRSKFVKALSPHSNNLQQPYYQQYLNASSPTSPQPPSPRPAGSSGGYVHSSGHQGGLSSFSGSGPKITTQQVQAKSKEFLHTAGVFGGKGMKAGKGLLAKGKSRFGNKSAGDKISSSSSAADSKNNNIRIGNAESRPSISSHFGHRRGHTVDGMPVSKLGRRSEDSVDDAGEWRKENRRSTFGFGGKGVGFGGMSVAKGRFSRLGKMGIGGEKGKESRELDNPGFTPDLRGVHQMHLKKSEESTPTTLPAIKINSNLESPQRASSMDSTSWAAREEYHRHKRSESGLSHHSRSGSALSGSRRDMSFFLADEDVSEESRDGSVSYGESVVDENVCYGVAKPAPISKLQPTWDPYMASPILEGEEDSPLSRYGNNVVKLVEKKAIPTSVPTNESSKTARVPVGGRDYGAVLAAESLKAATIPIPTSQTIAESPIIGLDGRDSGGGGGGWLGERLSPGEPNSRAPAGILDVDDERDDWVIVNDAQPVAGQKSSDSANPTSIREIYSTPPEYQDTSSVINIADHVGLNNYSAQPGMISTEREITTPSEISIDSVLELENEESPIVAPKPFQPFVNSGMMTPDELESPIIPNIFRTIKGDPPTQYARVSGSMKPEGQESPMFSLPPIRRGSTFSTLMNGWPGALSRSGSRSSKASRRFLVDADDDEPEEIPPVPPTPGFARPGSSDSAKRAEEKMKAVSVAESDISQPEENATIGALVAAGLVAGVFGDEKPSPISERHSSPVERPEDVERASPIDTKTENSELKKPDVIPEPPGSAATEGTKVPKPTNGSRESQITFMSPVVVHEQAPEVPDRPSTPINQTGNATHPILLLATPEGLPQSPDQSTPGTLVDESSAPDRLSKSSQQWVEAAPMLDSYIPPSHPPPNHPPPSLPEIRPESSLSQKSPEIQERRSQRPEIWINTTPEPSPSSSTKANCNTSPPQLQHRSLPSYESPRVFIPPTTMRQSYSGVGNIQTQLPSSSKMNEQIAPRDLPQHLYQAPISKEESFLPRQQISEYQIPGIGPPDEIPQSATRSSRRSSAAFFKEIGGRLSRSGSLAPEDSPVYRHNGAVTASVSSITSDDIREKIRNQSRRSSMFGLGSGSLSRSSTNNASGNGLEATGATETSDGLKLSHRESMITHRPGSRRDTLESWSEGGRSPKSVLGRVDESGGDKKGTRAFFGGKPAARGVVPQFSGMMGEASSDKGKTVKKSRFRLSGLLGRSGKKESISEENAPPPTANSLSSIQQTPIEYRPRNKSLGHLPILARPLGRGNKNPTTDENHARANSEERARQRKEAAHALLTGPLPPAYTPPANGFIDQIDRMEDEPERDPEKDDISMHLHPIHRPPPKQTPVFIEEFPDRGRRKNKELQYDTPPIPGAYGMVRGEGNGVDGRGYGSQLPPFQQDLGGYTRSPQTSQSPPKPTYTQAQSSSSKQPQHHPSTSSYTTPPLEPQSFPSQRPSPSDLDTNSKKPPLFREDSATGRIAYQSPQLKTRRNVSREDLLARSPARPIFGQQRPYQLSLPEEREDDISPTDVRLRAGSSSRDIGLGLGVENLSYTQGQGQIHGRNMSTSNVPTMGQGQNQGNHLGLHPDLKRRPESESWQALPVVDTVFETTPSLHGKPSLLSPELRQDEIARSNSSGAISQISIPRNQAVVSPQQTESEYNRDIYDCSPIMRNHGPVVSGNGAVAEAEEKIVDEENRGRSDIVELPASSSDDDRVVMCATSYPGMEWNPYAYGEMEYD